MTKPAASTVPLLLIRLLWTGLLTLGLELLTIAMRFGAELQSTRDTASFISPFTFGCRIHHGYIGIVLLLVGWVMAQKELQKTWLVLAIGLALVASDCIHHFAVLWPLTGSPEFDLVYPPQPVVEPQLGSRI